MRISIPSARFSGLSAVLTIILVFALLIAGCSSGAQPAGSTKPAASPGGAPSASSAPAKAEPVKIALVGPKTGAGSAFGVQSMNGVMQAAEDICNEGGIKALGGACFQVTVADTQSKPDVALSEAERLLTQEKADVMIGSFMSGTTQVTSQLAEERQVPNLSTLAASDPLTERGFKYFFRMNQKASWTAFDRADFAKYLLDQYGKAKGAKLSKVALINGDSEGVQSLAKGMSPALAKAGLQEVANVSFADNSADVTAPLLKIKDAQPDLLLTNTNPPDEIQITKTMDRLGMNALPVMGQPGRSTMEWSNAVGPLAEGGYETFIWNSDVKLPGLSDRIQRAKAKFGLDPSGDWAHAYQLTYVLKEAYEKAGSKDKKALRDALSKTNYTGPVWTAPFKGNTIAFDETGQLLQKHVVNVGMQLQSGKWATIYPEEFAAAKIQIK